MIRILPKNPDVDDIGSSQKRWGTGYFNNIDLGSTKKAVLLVAYNEETVTGTEPDIMKEIMPPQHVNNSPIMVETWGQIKITSTSPGYATAQISVALKKYTDPLKSYEFYSTLTPNGVVTLPFCLSAITTLGGGVQPLRAEINWVSSPDFIVVWSCQCIRVYQV